MNAFPPLAAMLLYAAATWLLWRGLSAADGLTVRHWRMTLLLAGAAALFHALLLSRTLFGEEGLNLSLTSALSLTACGVLVVYLLTCLRRPVESLGLFVLPAAAVTVAVEWAFPGARWLAVKGSPLQSLHLAAGLLAYCLLAVAMVQGLLLALQERLLRSHHPRGLLAALPPIETMEVLLFQMVLAGFVLLTLTILSGTLFTEAVFGRPLRLSHHIVLSLASWLLFAVLLAGHWRYGWRGRAAVLLLLAAFALLVLGYFGTKFVLEILLQR